MRVLNLKVYIKRRSLPSKQNKQRLYGNLRKLRRAQPVRISKGGNEMNTGKKRLLALLLTFSMAFSIMSPITAFATVTDGQTDEAVAGLGDANLDTTELNGNAQNNQVNQLSVGAELEVTNYADFLANLKVLETYADAFAAANPGRDAGELVLNFIRTGVERYLHPLCSLYHVVHTCLERMNSLRFVKKNI